MNAPRVDNQDAIWRHFQGLGPAAFQAGNARLDFLADRLTPGAKVLNIGIGGGRLETRAQARGVDIHAVDPDEETVATLREHLRLDDTRVKSGRIAALPFPDRCFDTVVASEVLEHLAETEISGALAEIHRVLGGEGEFLGTVPSRENLADSLCVCPDCGKPFHRWGHQQSFDDSTMTSLLSRNRLAPIEVYSRPFVTIRDQNWKGKIGAIAKHTLWRLGVHGGGECIVFRARRA